MNFSFYSFFVGFQSFVASSLSKCFLIMHSIINPSTDTKRSKYSTSHVTNQPPRRSIRMQLNDQYSNLFKLRPHTLTHEQSWW